jgi:hypothetical protein
MLTTKLSRQETPNSEVEVKKIMYFNVADDVDDDGDVDDDDDDLYLT